MKSEPPAALTIPCLRHNRQGCSALIFNLLLHWNPLQEQHYGNKQITLPTQLKILLADSHHLKSNN